MAEAEPRLVEAIKAGDGKAVEALLGERPERARGRAGPLSLVMLATYYRHPELVPLLLAGGDERDLFESCATGAPQRVAAFLDADPAAVNLHAPDGHTPLGLASFFGQPEVVRLLLARGASPDVAAANEMKVRPLHAAAAGAHTEIVRLLLAAGADPNAAQQAGYAPLHEAAHENRRAIAEALVAAGARADLENDRGRTPVDLAREAGHTDMADWLASTPPGPRA